MKTFEGFNLVEIAEDYWAIEGIPGMAFSGSFKEVVIFAIYRFNLRLKEIELAVSTMVERGDNVANFGIMGNFIYSFKKVEQVETFVV